VTSSPGDIAIGLLIYAFVAMVLAGLVYRMKQSWRVSWGAAIGIVIVLALIQLGSKIGH